MAGDCLFCRILMGEEPGYFVYDDEKVGVFLDINQAAPGHLLVVPKSHVAYWWELGEEYAAHMAVIARPLMQALRQVFHPGGINLVQNNGHVAGQEIFHVHLHLIPRWEGDRSARCTRKYEPDDVMRERAEQIREALRAYLA